MRVRTIKDVDDETWKLIKEISRREKMRVGMLLKDMAKEYKSRPATSWEKILNTKPILTEEEAKDIMKIIDKVRHEYGFRE